MTTQPSKSTFAKIFKRSALLYPHPLIYLQLVSTEATELYSRSANGGLRYAVSQFAGSAALQSYYSLIIYLVIAFILCALLAGLAYLFSLSTMQDTEKLSEYECGFEPFDSATRLPFDVHFYLVGILFLIFDVEIVLLFPWVMGVGLIGWFGFFAMIFFLALLGVGFLYEWKRGALIWPSRQHESTYHAE